MTVLSWAAIMALAAQPTCTYPGMVQEFWPAVVHQEARHGDGYSPYAVHDDTADQSFYPDTPDFAARMAVALMGIGHSVGVGLSQLTARSVTEFQTKFGMSVQDAMDPCANMRAGALHYVDRALRIYNSGSPDRSASYAASVRARIDATTGKEIPIPAAPSPRQPDAVDLTDRPATISGEAFFDGE